MPSWLVRPAGTLPATAASQRLTKTDATDATSGFSPAAMRRSMPQRNASAVAGKVPAGLTNQLGIAVANRTYQAYRELLCSPRWQRAYNAGARPQRLLWASTGTKDPKASDVLYVKALAAPFTVNTVPE